MSWLLHDCMTRVTCCHLHHANEATQESCSGPCAVRPLQAGHHLASAAAALLGCYVMKRPATPAPGQTRGTEQGESRPQTMDWRWRWRDDDGQVFPTPFPSPAIVPSLRRGQDLNITSMLESSQFIYHQEVGGRGRGPNSHVYFPCKFI